LLDLAGLGALGVLVLLCLRLGEYEPSLYRGGFAVVGLASAGLIAVVVHPSARLGANLLGRQPLRWIGLRSYGIYLWHWPVFMVTRPQLDVSIEGLPLLALRLGTTLLLAEISYRWVETPIRRGALRRAWQAMRDTEGRRRRRLRMLWAGAAVPVMVCCAVLGVAVAQAKPPSTPSYLSTKRVHIEASDQRSEPASTAESASSSTAAPAVAQKTAAAKEKPAPPADASERQPQTQAREAPANRTRQAATNDASNRALTATAIGDSVMLGAVDRLQKEIPNLTTIDARGSRQAPEAIGILRQLRITGKLGDVVIVHMGNNGIFTAREFDEMMRVLSSARKVLVVNVTVPDGYSWVPNNKVLANGVRRYPDKAVLVDWYSASAGHPEYFWDGLHLTPQGARAYADLIAATYKQQVR
jgi:lysophospholipase L1-like esterase